MNPATLIPLIEGIISLEPEAQAAWTAIKQLWTSGQPPTTEQWATLNALTDAAHAAVQAA